ncbi:hypothetical protein DYB32_003590 [Aphanomyces invadans]|uniref:RING-type domain-containing protein n=1 Tax=Aphanomyces invadans TaxID=157072 RepID=A0A418B053_9STRA|nr:hypothetical protein DYB32_003590 [Aphanomyces invadans]
MCRNHSGRRVATNQLRPSHASLIIVPDTLMAHWSYQLKMHTTGLRVLFDSRKNVPDVDVLEQYDVVVTSFGRLATHWMHHRPLSALERRAPERLGSENQRNYADGVEHKSLSPLSQLHWVRIIVDEGHKLGGTAITNAMQMLCSLSADKRWIMTGTPTPHVAQTDGLRHLHGLLRFLQEMPYGCNDGKPWYCGRGGCAVLAMVDGRLQAIAKPFEAKCVKGYMRLERLLNRIMLRHVKADVASIPPPIFITTVVNPTPVEFRIYNGVVGVVRGNLIVTKWDPETPGPLHKDSLLNPDNRYEGLGCAQYMRNAQDGNCTPCEVCRRELQFVMVTVCGHLVCADCIEKHVDTHGFVPGPVLRTTCPVCKATFDWEHFQELQPGFDYKWTSDDASPAPVGSAPLGVRPPPTQPPSLAPGRIDGVDGDEDHIWASSKGLDFQEHIYRIRPDFARAGLRFVSFLSGEVKLSARLQQLRDFRDNDDIHVLFMTEIGAIGLDLSFVTHIFLMDEIWDKSVEKQVIARAHRMGATESVIVEQLEMRGSMEALVRELYAVPQHQRGVERHSKEGKSQHKRAKAKQSKSLFRVMNKESMSSLRLYHVLKNVRMIEGPQQNGSTVDATTATCRDDHQADIKPAMKRARIGGG